MGKLNIVKFLAGFTSMVGVSVMVGWIFNIGFLKSILPQFVTMKFTTALCFVLSGMILYSVTKIQTESEIGKIIVLLLSFVIMLMMTVLLISIFLNIKVGLEDLFVRESAGAIKTIVPGRPALNTVINFIIIAGIGFLSVLGKKSLKIIKKLAVAVGLLGVLAIVGYLIDVPQLYGHINYFSTVMALHTAILFVLLGLGFFIIPLETASSGD